MPRSHHRVTNGTSVEVPRVEKNQGWFVTIPASTGPPLQPSAPRSQSSDESGALVLDVRGQSSDESGALVLPTYEVRALFYSKAWPAYPSSSIWTLPR